VAIRLERERRASYRRKKRLLSKRKRRPVSKTKIYMLHAWQEKKRKVAWQVKRGAARQRKRETAWQEK
jgi:hypothetical protein